MGVARIVSHQGKGLYNVDMLLRTGEIVRQRAHFTDLLTKLEKGEANLIIALDEANTAKLDAESGLDTLIDAPLFPVNGEDISQGITTPQAKRDKAIKDLTAEVTKQKNIIVRLNVELDANRVAQVPVILNKKLYTEDIITHITLDVWCIDYTTDLIMLDEQGQEVVTYVETIESMDEYQSPNTFINLRPLTADTLKRLEKKIDAEGRLTEEGRVDARMLPELEHVLGSKPWTILYNLTALPSMQKWKPNYKIATITSVNYTEETCSISFSGNPFESSLLPYPLPFHFPAKQAFDKRYNVQNEPSHVDVPIEYMYCGAEPFKIDDKVIINYVKRNLDAPVVIGFRSDPLRCAAQYLLYKGIGESSVYKAVPVGDRGIIDPNLDNTIDLSSGLNSMFDDNTLDSGWTASFNKNELLSGYHKPNNVTAAHRLSAGIRVHSIEGEEFSDVYTFNNYKIFKNGVEMSLGFDFENAVTYPELFPNIIGSQIVGVQYKFGFLYVVSISLGVKPHAAWPSTTFFELGTPGPVLLPQEDYPGFLVTQLTDDGFLVDQYGIYTKFYYKISPTSPVKQTITIRDIDTNIVQSSPLEGAKVAWAGFSPFQFLSYIFDVDVAEDTITISGTVRPYFTSGTADTASFILIAQRDDGLPLGFIYSILDVTQDGVSGSMHLFEEETDTLASSGKLSSKGDLQAIEQDTDTFIGAST